jgi:hypothetical protein
MTDWRESVILCTHPDVDNDPDYTPMCKHEIRMGRCPDHDCEGWIYRNVEPIE